MIELLKILVIFWQAGVMGSFSLFFEWQIGWFSLAKMKMFSLEEHSKFELPSNSISGPCQKLARIKILFYSLHNKSKEYITTINTTDKEYHVRKIEKRIYIRHYKKILFQRKSYSASLMKIISIWLNRTACQIRGFQFVFFYI